jgi:hypothetical protein
MTQASEKQFQVIYRQTDNLIVGLSPKGGGVGPNNRLAVLHDMTEYDNLMKFDPAYLSADKLHIVGAPPEITTDDSGPAT